MQINKPIIKSPCEFGLSLIKEWFNKNIDISLNEFNLMSDSELKWLKRIHHTETLFQETRIQIGNDKWHFNDN